MAAPQLIVSALSVVTSSVRQHFLPWSLCALSFALVVFQSWVWWFVPAREGGLAWVLYVPISAIILVLVAAASLWWARFNNSRQHTPSAPTKLDR